MACLRARAPPASGACIQLRHCVVRPALRPRSVTRPPPRTTSAACANASQTSLQWRAALRQRAGCRRTPGAGWCATRCAARLVRVFVRVRDDGADGCPLVATALHAAPRAHAPACVRAAAQEGSACAQPAAGATLPPAASRQLAHLRTRVLEAHGGTGVLLAVSCALALRPPCIAFPVADLGTCR